MKFSASFSGNRGDIVQCLKQSLHSQDAWQFSSGKPKLAKMHKNNFLCCIFAQTVGLLILTLTAMLYASFR